MENSKTKKGNFVAIIAMIFLFAMIAFVTNLCSPMAKILKHAFNISETLSQVGNYCNFGAYFVMGIPAGLLINKYGFKKTSLVALLVGIVGLAFQWLSGSMGFIVYIIGAFISGLCMCMLNTVVNPMLNLLGGGGNTGNQLVQIGGVFNSAAAVCVYIIMGQLIGDPEKAEISKATPAFIIALAIFVFALIVIFFTKIQEPEQAKVVETKDDSKYSCYSFRHFKLGLLAIAVYGAVEVCPPNYIFSYLSEPIADGGLGMTTAFAGSLCAIYFIFMLIGRFVGGMIGGMVSAKTMIGTVSFVSMVLIALGMMLPIECTISFPGIDYVSLSLVWGEIPVGIVSFMFVGLCASVMWGGIFNLATEGLGKYTTKASGAFMMMVAGFGVMILLQALVIDLTHSYIQSFIVVLLSAAYIFYYALWGSKNVNTDIPVE